MEEETVEGHLRIEGERRIKEKKKILTLEEQGKRKHKLKEQQRVKLESWIENVLFEKEEKIYL